MQKTNTAKPTDTKNTTDKPKAWWHYGLAWMVFGGPAAVVVACMYTIYLAVVGQDPVLDENYYQKGIEINKTVGDDGRVLTVEERNSLEPANRARNHAATGVNQE
jgi:hypothetical protein